MNRPTKSNTGHIRSWYAATAHILPNCPTLEESIDADVCIVGGGFTGLAAALTLSRAGYRVALVESRRIGWGASGRNGGFCCLGGSAASDAVLRRMHGEEARRAWRR